MAKRCKVVIRVCNSSIEYEVFLLDGIIPSEYAKILRSKHNGRSDYSVTCTPIPSYNPYELTVEKINFIL